MAEPPEARDDVLTSVALLNATSTSGTTADISAEVASPPATQNKDAGESDDLRNSARKLSFTAAMQESTSSVPSISAPTTSSSATLAAATPAADPVPVARSARSDNLLLRSIASTSAGTEAAAASNAGTVGGEAVLRIDSRKKLVSGSSSRGPAARAAAAGASAAQAVAATPARLLLPADEVVVLIDNAAMLTHVERALWHQVNINARLPKRLWREKDGMCIVSATGSSGIVGAAQTGAAGADQQLHHHRHHRHGHRRRVVSCTDPGVSLRMSQSTLTRYIYKSYRIVIGIDASPSMFSLDPHTSTIAYNDACGAVERVIYGLVVQMQCNDDAGRARAASMSHLGMSNGEATNPEESQPAGLQPGHSDQQPQSEPPAVLFTPAVYVSIVVQARSPGPAHDAGTPYIIAHGVELTRYSASGLCSLVRTGMEAAVRSQVAEAEAEGPGSTAADGADKSTKRSRLSSEHASPADRPLHGKHAGAASAQQLQRHASLAPLLESSISLLKLLPSHACPSLLLVTDGVAGLPGLGGLPASAASDVPAAHTAADTPDDSSGGPSAAPSSLSSPDSTVGLGSYGSVLMQMQRHDVVANVLQVGTCSGVHSPLGIVPDTESLQFLATSTGGFRVRQRDLGVFLATRGLATNTSAGQVAEQTAASSAASGVETIGAPGSTLAPLSSATIAPPPFSTRTWSRLQRCVFIRSSVLGSDLDDDDADAAVGGDQRYGGGMVVPTQPSQEESADLFVHARPGGPRNGMHKLEMTSPPLNVLNPSRHRPQLPHQQATSKSEVAHGQTARRSQPLSRDARSFLGTVAAIRGHAGPGTEVTNLAHSSKGDHVIGTASVSDLAVQSRAAAASVFALPSVGWTPPASSAGNNTTQQQQAMVMMCPGGADGIRSLFGITTSSSSSPLIVDTGEKRDTGALVAGTTRSRAFSPIAAYTSTSSLSALPMMQASSIAPPAFNINQSLDFSRFPWTGPPPPVLMSTQRIASYSCRCDAMMLLECRLRDGFRVILAGQDDAHASGTPPVPEPAVGKSSGGGKTAAIPAKKAASARSSAAATGASTGVVAPSSAPAKPATLDDGNAGGKIVRLALLWQPQVLLIYTVHKTSSTSGADAGTAPTTGQASKLSAPKQRGKSSPSASEAQGRPPASSAALSAAASSTLPPARYQTVLVTIDMIARQDFVQQYLAVEAAETIAKHQYAVQRQHHEQQKLLVQKSAGSSSAAGRPVHAEIHSISGLPLPAPPSNRRVANAAVAGITGAVGRATASKSSVPASLAPSGQAPPAPAPPKVSEHTLRPLARLSQSAVEPTRCRVLRGFIQVLGQNDATTVHLCNQPALKLAALPQGGSGPVTPGPDAGASSATAVSAKPYRLPSSLLFYTPFASSSLSAWHRFFDVECFDVCLSPVGDGGALQQGVDAPHHGTPPSADGDDPVVAITASAHATATSESSSDAVASQLLSTVQTRIASWAHAALPDARSLFVDGAADVKALAASECTSSHIRFLNATATTTAGQEGLAAAASSGTSGRPSGVEAPPQPEHLKQVQTPTLRHNHSSRTLPSTPQAPAAAAAAAMASDRSASSRSLLPAAPALRPGGNMAKGAAPSRSRSPPTAEEGPLLGTGENRAADSGRFDSQPAPEVAHEGGKQPFIIVQASLAHDPGSSSQRSDDVNRPWIVNVRVALFGCPPPLRSAQLRSLKDAIDGLHQPPRQQHAQQIATVSAASAGTTESISRHHSAESPAGPRTEVAAAIAAAAADDGGNRLTEILQAAGDNATQPAIRIAGVCFEPHVSPSPVSRLLLASAAIEQDSCPGSSSATNRQSEQRSHTRHKLPFGVHAASAAASMPAVGSKRPHPLLFDDAEGGGAVHVPAGAASSVIAAAGLGPTICCGSTPVPDHVLCQLLAVRHGDISAAGNDVGIDISAVAATTAMATSIGGALKNVANEMVVLDGWTLLSVVQRDSRRATVHLMKIMAVPSLHSTSMTAAILSTSAADQVAPVLSFSTSSSQQQASLQLACIATPAGRAQTCIVQRVVDILASKVDASDLKSSSVTVFSRTFTERKAGVGC